MGYYCYICGEWTEYEKTAEVNFLWDDKFVYGKPLCESCANLWKDNKHLNYEFKKKEKKRNLERFF